MTFTEKSIKYADLIIPFTRCTLGEAVVDCPFKEYWEMGDEDKQVDLVDELSEDKLNELQEFHRKCLKAKIKEAQDNTTRIYEIF